MSKYIDVNVISNRLRSRLGYFGLYHPEDTKNIEELQTCLELINGTPAAEVKPIVYGEWIDINGIKSCNQCGAGNASAYDSFCPNCGAVMNMLPRIDSDENGNYIMITQQKLGHWIPAGLWSEGCGMGENYGSYYTCSLCGERVKVTGYSGCDHKYCPSCGMKMQEERNE